MIVEIKSAHGEAIKLLNAAEAEVTRLRQRVEEQDAALEPFAKYGELHAGQRPEFVEIGLWANNSKGEPDGIELTSGDFFRARSARTKEPNND